MRIETLRYILKIAQKKSINQAAQELFISRQQLSYIIKEAEKELGITLFERTSNHLTVPEKNKTVFADIANIVQTYDQMLDHINVSAPAVTGTLKLITNANVWNSGTEITQQFSRLFPKIQLKFRSLSCENIIKAIQQGKYDIALFNQATVNHRDCYPIPPELCFTPGIRLPVAHYAAQKYPALKTVQPISLKKAAELPLIDFKPYDDGDTIMHKILHNVSEKINIKYEINDARVLFNLIEDGQGVFLSTWGQNTVFTIADRQIQIIPLKEKVFYTYGLLYKSESLNNPTVKAFSDFFLNYYKQRPIE